MPRPHLAWLLLLLPWPALAQPYVDVPHEAYTDTIRILAPASVRLAAVRASVAASVAAGPRFAWSIPQWSGDAQGNPIEGLPAGCRWFRLSYETSAGHFGVWRSGRVRAGSDGLQKWDLWTWDDGATWVRLTVSYADEAKNWAIPASVVGWWVRP